MMRVVSEIDGLGSKNDEQKKETGLFKHLKEQNREVLLHQGVRFAFRVHQVIVAELVRVIRGGSYGTLS